MLVLGHYGIYGNEPAQKGWTAHIFTGPEPISMGPFYTTFIEIVKGWEWEAISQHWAEASRLDHTKHLIMNHALGCKCGLTYVKYGYLM